MQQLIRASCLSLVRCGLRFRKQLSGALAAKIKELVVPEADVGRGVDWQRGFRRGNFDGWRRKQVLPSRMPRNIPTARHLGLLGKAEFIALRCEYGEAVGERSVISAAGNEGDGVKNKRTKY